MWPYCGASLAPIGCCFRHQKKRLPHLRRPFGSETLFLSFGERRTQSAALRRCSTMALRLQQQQLLPHLLPLTMVGQQWFATMPSSTAASSLLS